MKVCSKCLARKPLDDFAGDKNAPDGKFRWCKDCSRANGKKWYVANAEKKKQQVKEARKDPEHYKRQLESNRQWRARNPDKAREYAKRTHARRRGAPVADLTVDEWKDLLESANHQCVYCGVKFDENNPAQQDHILPVSLGGHHTKNNILPACRKCNRSKGNMTIVNFLRARQLGK